MSNQTETGNKDRRVCEELKRLSALFEKADGTKRAFIQKHVEQLAWLAVSIADLQKDIDENGPVVPYVNGRNQSGLQANPSCRLLIDYQKLYTAASKALLPVLPEDQEDTYAEFLENIDRKMDQQDDIQSFDDYLREKRTKELNLLGEDI